MRSTFHTIIVVFAVLIMSSCNNRASDNNTSENKKDPDILAQTFKTSDGWGYSVFINNRLFIKQEMIPVVAGIKSFANEEDAKNVANLVVLKLKHHQKPILKLEDLQKLGIVKS